MYFKFSTCICVFVCVCVHCMIFLQVCVYLFVCSLVRQTVVTYWSAFTYPCGGEEKGMEPYCYVDRRWFSQCEGLLAQTGFHVKAEVVGSDLWNSSRCLVRAPCCVQTHTYPHAAVLAHLVWSSKARLVLNIMQYDLGKVVEVTLRDHSMWTYFKLHCWLYGVDFSGTYAPTISCLRWQNVAARIPAHASSKWSLLVPLNPCLHFLIFTCFQYLDDITWWLNNVFCHAANPVNPNQTE